MIVGNGGSGKTCLLNALKSGQFVETEFPTICEMFTVQMDVDDVQVKQSASAEKSFHLHFFVIPLQTPPSCIDVKKRSI